MSHPYEEHNPSVASRAKQIALAHEQARLHTARDLTETLVAPQNTSVISEPMQVMQKIIERLPSTVFEKNTPIVIAWQKNNPKQGWTTAIGELTLLDFPPTALKAIDTQGEPTTLQRGYTYLVLTSQGENVDLVEIELPSTTSFVHQKGMFTRHFVNDSALQEIIGKYNLAA